MTATLAGIFFGLSCAKCQVFLSIKNPRLLVLLTAEKYFNAKLYFFILGDCFYEGSTFKVSKKYSMFSYRQFYMIWYGFIVHPIISQFKTMISIGEGHMPVWASGYTLH